VTKWLRLSWKVDEPESGRAPAVQAGVTPVVGDERVGADRCEDLQRGEVPAVRGLHSFTLELNLSNSRTH